MRNASASKPDEVGADPTRATSFLSAETAMCIYKYAMHQQWGYYSAGRFGRLEYEAGKGDRLWNELQESIKQDAHDYCIAQIQATLKEVLESDPNIEDKENYAKGKEYENVQKTEDQK